MCLHSKVTKNEARCLHPRCVYIHAGRPSFPTFIQSTGPFRAPSLIIAAGLAVGIVVPAGGEVLLVVAAGVLLLCFIAAVAEERARRLTSRSRPGPRRSRLSAFSGILMLIAAVSTGVIAAGSERLETTLDVRASREASSAWRTFRGTVCDQQTAASSAPRTSGGPGTRLVRSITVCNPSGSRPGRIRVSFLDKQLDAGQVTVGDVVVVTGRAEQPRPPMNPYAFDEAEWLGALRIHTVVTDPARLRLIGARADPGSRLDSRARRVHDQLRNRIDRRFQLERHRALAAAILLGDRSDIDHDIRDRFVRSGLMHLLALSGLHIGLIGGFVWIIIDSIFRRTPLSGRMRRTLRTLTWTAAMGWYGWIVAWPVSVIRALVMAAAFLAASTAGRRCSPWQVYGIAAATLFLISPGSLFSAGFQLSFAAVGGIIFVRPEKDPHPACVRDQSDAIRAMWSALRASVAAGVATMPVLLYHFGSAPTAGIVLSPPGILLMGPVLASAAAAVVLPAALAVQFAHASSAGLDLIISLGGFEVAWLPDIRQPPGSWSAVPAAVVLAGGLLWFDGGRRRLHVLTTSAVAGIVLTGLSMYSTLPGPVHTIVFFAAGQGDATHVLSASGRTLLIDAAPGAARPVLDYHDALGLDRIDTVVLTHDHADHTAGLMRLAERPGAGRIIHTGWLDSRPGDRSVTAGDTLGLDQGIRIDVLNPDRIRDDHGNDDSVVLRLRIGQITLLLMGDAEAAAEQRLLRRYGELLGTDVVKAGHHGSSTSSSVRFVRTSAPGIVVLSAGRNNRFGHPSPRVVERWVSAGAHVHVTSERGALVLETNGVDVRVRRPAQ